MVHIPLKIKTAYLCQVQLYSFCGFGSACLHGIDGIIWTLAHGQRSLFNVNASALSSNREGQLQGTASHIHDCGLAHLGIKQCYCKHRCSFGAYPKKMFYIFWICLYPIQHIPKFSSTVNGRLYSELRFSSRGNRSAFTQTP